MKRVVKTNIAVRFTVTCKKSLLKNEYNVNLQTLLYQSHLIACKASH